MKRISLAIENFNPRAGGAESYAVAMANRMIEKGWEVHLFGKSWDGNPPQAIFHQIDIPRWLPAFWQILSFAVKHRKQVKKNVFDVVLGFGNTIDMNVYQSHGGVHAYSTYRKTFSERVWIKRKIKQLLCLLSLKNWARHWIESAPFRMNPYPKLIAISDMIKRDMVNAYRCKPENIQVIYNGVDTTRFNSQLSQPHRRTIRQRHHIHDDDVVFLFTSFSLKKKGFIVLLEAVSQMKKKATHAIKLLVVGKNMTQQIEKKVARLSIVDHVIFAGPRADMVPYYGAADVFVLPTYYDACSLVVIEAMACGLPIITTEYNGASELIKTDINGFVISHPPQVQDLIFAMNSLLEFKTRCQMSKEAEKTGRKYSLGKNFDAMFSAFNQVLKK